MKSYEVIQSPPGLYEGIWELLVERFGSDSFSEQAAVRTIEAEYPTLEFGEAKSILGKLVRQGSLREEGWE